MSADGEIQKDTGERITGANDGDETGATEVQPGGDQQDQDAAKEKSRRGVEPAAGPAGVLPNKAAEDDPRRWGDQPDSYDHDAWLQEQKPPHWG